MAREVPASQVISVRNRVAEKLDRTGGPTPEEIEASLDEILREYAERYPAVVRGMCGKVRALLAEVDGAADSERTLRAVMRQFHDMKGQAATLGFPLIGEAAAAVCDLILIHPDVALSRLGLVEIYADAIDLMALEGIRSRADERGATLIESLDAAMSKMMTESR